MKLMFTASNRPDAPKGPMPTKGKDVWYDHEEKVWKSRPWGCDPKLSMHPVDIGQGVC